MMADDTTEIKIMWECTKCDTQFVDKERTKFCYYCHEYNSVVFLCNWSEQLHLFTDESVVC